MRQFFEFMRGIGVVITIVINIVALVWFASTLHSTVQENRSLIMRNAEAVECATAVNNKQDICIAELSKDVSYLTKLCEKIDRKI